MIEHNDAGAVAITIDGEPLHQRLANSVPELVDEVLDGLVEHLPDYRSLPGEQLGGDIRRIVERHIRAFVEVVRTGSPTSPGVLAELREAVAQRAAEGVPIDAVLRAHHLGVEMVWESFGTDAGPDDLAGAIALSKLQLAYLRDVTTSVSAGYLEHRAMFGAQHAARQSLLSALLGGTDVVPAAERAGIELPAAYFVVGVDIAVHPDENRCDVDTTVAARRKLRRMRTELERHVRQPVLSTLTPGGGTALLPATSPEPATADWPWLADLVRSAGRAAGADITTGVVLARPEDVAGAATTAREVLAAAVAAGKPAGTYRLDDVALEFQLSRPGPARDQLAALLGPLENKPELLTTLRIYLRSGLSRRHTAKQLHIHPNTVDYRLRKVAALSGLDTTAAGELPRIHAAITAWQAIRLAAA